MNVYIMEGEFLHMTKRCECGAEMEITIRTLYFNKNVEIKHVPTYTCPVCSLNQVMDQVKSKLKETIKKLESSEKKKTVKFDEVSEFTQLMMMVYQEQEFSSNGTMLQEEVQQLLEQYLLEETKEEYWEKQIHKKIERYVQ